MPQLVFNTDEATLNTMSELLGCPVDALLEASLPSCMVLILTCWAQGEGEGQGQGREGEGQSAEEIRQQATAGHELLCKHMSEDVRR